MKVFPIIKCVGVSCNLRCSYCYHHESDQRMTSLIRIPDKIVETIISQTAEINGGICHCLWHGGEPLLAGIDFFERVVSIQKKFIDRGVRIINSVQTNGTLITKRWVDFFKKYHFRVGVSIDGPKHIHDHYRKTARHKDSFEKTMRGITICHNNGCNVSVIAAITDYSAQFPEELFKFFIATGIRTMSFNPVYETDLCGKPLPYSVSDKMFSDFLLQIFDLWINADDPNIIIRQFTDPLTKLCGGSVSTCIFSGKCANFLEFYPDGTVRPCHGFKTVALGNITQKSLAEIIADQKYQDLVITTQSVPQQCTVCKWFPICNGGCCDHRNTAYNEIDSAVYQFCNSRKKIFAKLDKFVANNVLYTELLYSNKQQNTDVFNII